MAIDAVAEYKQAAAREINKYMDMTFSLKAALAEFICMTLFVFVGTASAMGNSMTYAVGGPRLAVFSTQQYGYNDGNLQDGVLAPLQTVGCWGLTVALAFGWAICVLVYAVAHISGGQLNPAVSLGLFITGRLPPPQLIGNVIAQYGGACIGALCTKGVFFDSNGTGLASNAVAPAFNENQALLGEIMMTCLLVFTVLQTACEPRSIAKNMAPMAIGMAVFLGHTVLLSVDGCSINPARSFGSAAVGNYFRNFWVFNVGPFVGAIFAAMVHWTMYFDWDPKIGSQTKGLATNEISEDNSGLCDAALRVGAKLENTQSAKTVNGGKDTETADIAAV